MDTYSTNQIGPNHSTGGVHAGFVSEAYQAAPLAEKGGEKLAPSAPTANPNPTKANNASQLGRECRPR